MYAEKKIRMSKGKKFVYSILDETTGQHIEDHIVDKKTGLKLLENAEVFKYIEEDGIGILIFYKEDPSVVHSLLMVA